MFNPEEEAIQLMQYLNRTTDISESIRINMIRIYLSGAYFRGELAGTWCTRDTNQPDNALTTNNFIEVI